jgi:hypothetical protein
MSKDRYELCDHAPGGSCGNCAIDIPAGRAVREPGDKFGQELDVLLYGDVYVKAANPNTQRQYDTRPAMPATFEGWPHKGIQGRAVNHSGPGEYACGLCGAPVVWDTDAVKWVHGAIRVTLDNTKAGFTPMQDEDETDNDAAERHIAAQEQREDSSTPGNAWRNWPKRCARGVSLPGRSHPREDHTYQCSDCGMSVRWKNGTWRHDVSVADWAMPLGLIDGKAYAAWAKRIGNAFDAFLPLPRQLATPETPHAAWFNRGIDDANAAWRGALLNGKPDPSPEHPLAIDARHNPAATIDQLAVYMDGVRYVLDRAHAPWEVHGQKQAEAGEDKIKGARAEYVIYDEVHEWPEQAATAIGGPAGVFAEPAPLEEAQERIGLLEGQIERLTAARAKVGRDNEDLRMRIGEMERCVSYALTELDEIPRPLLTKASKLRLKLARKALRSLL